MTQEKEVCELITIPPTEEQKSTEEWRSEMVSLQIEVNKHFLDFLKDYLSFFGSNMTIEEQCAQMVYDGARHLHSDLTGFLERPQSRPYFAGVLPWFNKYKLLAETTGRVPKL